MRWSPWSRHHWPWLSLKLPLWPQRSWWAHHHPRCWRWQWRTQTILQTPFSDGCVIDSGRLVRKEKHPKKKGIGVMGTQSAWGLSTVAAVGVGGKSLLTVLLELLQMHP